MYESRMNAGYCVRVSSGVLLLRRGGGGEAEDQHSRECGAQSHQAMSP